jgi:hypothetical protein
MFRNALIVVIVGLSGLTFAAGQQPVDTTLLAKAKGGDGAAQVAVGEQYARLAGAAQDPDDAAEDWKQSADWYRKAAEQGNAPGEIHLAECYRDGRGVARDMSQAAEWYRKAADGGDPGAQGTLAMLYTLGQGVPQSDVDAYFWFDLAAAVPSANRERYITNRQNVGTRITADDLVQIKRREKEWKAAHPRAEQ